MSGWNPPSYSSDGFKKWLHGMERRIKDLERLGGWQYDDDIEIAEALPGAATTPTTLVGFESPGWRYLTLADTTDYSDPDFDDSAWAVGDAMFGATTTSTPYTFATALPMNGRTWLRRTINGTLSNVTVTVRADNTGEAWWNGTYLGSFEFTALTTGDSHEFTVPASALAGVTEHVLAIRVTDDAGDGGGNDHHFADAEVVAGRLAADITVRKNSGADVGTRPRLNFIEGSNVTLTVADDGADDEVDITISSTAGAGGGYGAKTTLVIDAEPAVPGSLDDEFDDETLSGWTNQYAGTAPTWTERADGMLHVDTSAETGWNLKSLVKAVPSGDWTVATKLGPYSAASGDFHKVGGLVLAQGTTAQGAYVFTRGHSSIWRFLVERVNSYTSYNGSLGTLTTGFTTSWPAYLRIAKVGTTYTFQVSGDGVKWLTVYSGSLAFTPTMVGIGCNVENASHGIGATFGWFRRTA